MIDLKIYNVGDVSAYLDEQKYRILVGIRLGMRDAIVGLDKALIGAAAIHRGTGLLEEIIQRAMKIYETENAVIGIIHPRNHGAQPHYWLEFGVNHPETKFPFKKDGAATVMASGSGFFSEHNRAFVIPPKPFFYPTFEEYKTTMFEIISASVEKAMAA